MLHGTQCRKSMNKNIDTAQIKPHRTAVQEGKKMKINNDSC